MLINLIITQNMINLHTFILLHSAAEQETQVQSSYVVSFIYTEKTSTEVDNLVRNVCNKYMQLPSQCVLCIAIAVSQCE
jgi:hypothetical protein